MALHGYGGDERQLDTLLPLPATLTVIVPRAPFEVDPGFGWWLPEPDEFGVDLAPRHGIDRAVDVVLSSIRAAQMSEGLDADRTVLSGYSQGAMLALTVAARHPELLAGVVTGAGALMPTEVVRRQPERALQVLIMNGSLDPVVDVADHQRTIDAFERVGHRVSARYDPVPHVIDEEQAAFAAESITSWLGGLALRGS